MIQNIPREEIAGNGTGAPTTPVEDRKHFMGDCRIFDEKATACPRWVTLGFHGESTSNSCTGQSPAFVHTFRNLWVLDPTGGEQRERRPARVFTGGNTLPGIWIVGG